MSYTHGGENECRAIKIARARKRMVRWLERDDDIKLRIRRRFKTGGL